MIVVDTNIVVHFAVNDDPDLANMGVVPSYTFDAESCRNAIGRGSAPPVIFGIM